VLAVDLHLVQGSESRRQPESTVERFVRTDRAFLAETLHLDAERRREVQAQLSLVGVEVGSDEVEDPDLLLLISLRQGATDLRPSGSDRGAGSLVISH